MRRHSILDDISIDDLRRYREEGYGNREIAKLLDVSQQTIWRYLGPDGTKGARAVAPAKPVLAAPPLPEAVLRIEHMVVKLSGERGAAYEIVYEEGGMRVVIPGQAALIPDVSGMLSELMRVKELANQALAALYNEKLLPDA